jgi:putative Mg2+ transporter-C (MgtC) family protein
MMIDLSPEIIESLKRIGMAAVLGASIGFERDIRGRPAGLRTNLLLCVGASLFAIISQEVAGALLNFPGSKGFVSDPGRIAAQVVSGVGFLGAGVIIKEGLSVRGLTTAACLWLVSAIGVACGFGFTQIAIAVTIIGVTVLFFLNYIEHTYPKHSFRVLKITTVGSANISDFLAVVKDTGAKVIFCDYKKNYENNSLEITLTVRLFHKGITDKFSKKILDGLESSKLPVSTFEWARQLK